MSSLLVQSCSATKQDVDNPVQALDLYDGYFFRIIKKTVRAGRFQRGLDIVIISAKHGVVEPDDEIGYYDLRMNTERALELNPDVVETIAENVAENGHKKIWVNLGKDYLPAVDGLEATVDVPVRYIDGSGIGVKGKRLKRLVSSNRTVPLGGD